MVGKGWEHETHIRPKDYLFPLRLVDKVRFALLPVPVPRELAMRNRVCAGAETRCVLRDGLV